MGKEFTKNLMVKYLYKETSTAESDMVEDAIENDWELRETMDIIEKSNREIPKIKFAPKQSTIKNILGYSREQTALEPYF